MRQFTVLTLWVFALLMPAPFVAAEAEEKDGMDVYFRTASLMSLSDQALPEYPAVDPGESDVLARAWETAPPGISHTVEDMLPIGLKDNECLECHSLENAGTDDIPLSDAHHEIPQMGKGKKEMVWIVKGYKQGKEMNMARYECIMCHTTQASNVDTPNTKFVTMKEEKAKKKK
ncbi:MAG: nitrate reductase cytochrome c-type subunit [Deltaproteobacteria bacterium]|nr:nitrate reductase cytochrome c-type subunit [Deltaproteobacteria bacterium]